MPVVHEAQVLSAEPSPGAQTTSQRPTTTLPVGVIAGSLAGGVVLAIAVVLAWTYWGKSFHWQRRKHAVCPLSISLLTLLDTNHDEQGTVFTTRDNFRRRRKKSAFFTRCPEKLHFERKTSADIFDGYGRIPKVPTADVVEPSSPALSTASLVPSGPNKLSPAPRMLKKHRRRKPIIEKNPILSPIIDVDAEIRDPAVDLPLDPPILSPLPTIIHKPSTVGSSSIYSTQSGEERQFGVPPNYVLSELGLPDLNSPITSPPLAISHKPSNVSSLYSSQSGEERMFGVPPNFLSALDRRRFSTWTRSSGSTCSIVDEQPPSSAWAIPQARNIRGGADGHQPSRLSRVSCASTYMRPDNEFMVGDGENSGIEAEKKSETGCIL